MFELHSSKAELLGNNASFINHMRFEPRLSQTRLQASMSSGTLEPLTSQQQPAGDDVTPYDSRWQTRWRSRQAGVLRYNCADSLDRTNAASYFAAVQV